MIIYTWHVIRFKECMAMDNWTGNEVYIEMNR